MIEVVRKERETIPTFARRFSRRVQQSGILNRARKIRFYKKPPTRRLRRIAALRYAKIKREQEKLEKLGKLINRDFRHGA